MNDAATTYASDYLLWDQRLGTILVSGFIYRLHWVDNLWIQSTPRQRPQCRWQGAFFFNAAPGRNYYTGSVGAYGALNT